MANTTNTRKRTTYAVREMNTPSFDAAAAYAVGTALESHESVCIERRVAGKVVQRIDVTATLSIDDAAVDMPGRVADSVHRGTSLTMTDEAESALRDFAGDKRRPTNPRGTK